MPTISVNGAALFAVEEGDGDPIVLVHGTVADYRTWLLQIREFSRRHRVIAYSRRYHFPNVVSEDRPQYSASGHAQDLAELIRHRAGGKAHVVTSSFGGCIALALAVEHPHLVGSLVVCEAPLMPWLLMSDEGRALFPGVEKAQEASDRAFTAGRQREGVRLFIDMAMGSGVFEAMTPRSQARIMDNAYELSLEMAAPADIYFPQFTREDLRGLPVPVLLLSSGRSPPQYHIITEELATCLPRARRETIPNSGHVIHATNPIAFNNTVGSFIEQV